MKKILTIIALFLMLSGAGFPMIKGLLIERSVRQSVDQANQSFARNQNRFSVRIGRYDTGYQDSTIEWHLDLGVYKSVLGVEAIIFTDHVHHGYSSKIVSNTSLDKNQWYNNFVGKYLDGKSPLSITTEYSLSGDITSKIVLSGFTIKKENQSLVVHTGSGQFNFNNQMNRVKASVNWEGASLPDVLELSGINLSGNFSKAGSILWEGTAELKIDSLWLMENENAIDLESLRAAYVLDYDKENAAVAVDAELRLDTLETDLTTIDMGKLNIQMSNLDAVGLEELIRINASLQQELLRKIKPAENTKGEMTEAVEAQMRKIGLEMTGIYEKLLRKGLEINISNLYMKIPEGEIEASLFLKLKKSITPVGFLPVMMKPSMITDIISLESDFRLPYHLFGYQEALLVPLVDGMKTGLFIVKGSDLVHQARIRDGKMFLNGQELELE